MKSVQVAENILPIGEFKSRSATVLKRLRKDNQPIVITQNGRPAGVLISPEEFDRLAERERFIAAVSEGVSDMEAGRVVDDGELGAELDSEFGPLSSK